MDVHTTKKELRKARRLTHDELIGWLFLECTKQDKKAAARLYELRKRLEHQAPLGNPSDPRGDSAT